VLLSEMEGLPTVILEAMACGTPVLATPIAGVPDVVCDEETGFLVDCKNSEAIAQRVTELLSRDDLYRISKMCRGLAIEQYSFLTAVARYKSIFKSLAE